MADERDIQDEDGGLEGELYKLGKKIEQAYRDYQEKMNYKFRKKPVVIEAFQMTKERRWDNSEWPQWLHKAWNMPDLCEGSLSIDPDDPKREKLVIGTKEGVHRVTFDDWIIQGVQGELYACKPDIFEQTYESVQG